MGRVIGNLSTKYLETVLVTSWLVSFAAVGVGLFINLYVAAGMSLACIASTLIAWSELNRR